MKHWTIGLYKCSYLSYRLLLSFIWYILRLYPHPHTSNSTHHPSRSPFSFVFLCFIPSSFHTSYTLYSHLFHPICPLSYLLDNRISTSAAALLLHSYLTIDYQPWSASVTTLLRMSKHTVTRVVSSRTLSPNSTPKHKHIKGCFYFRICS